MPSPGTTTFLKRTLNSSNATYSTTYFGHGGSVHVERANKRLVDHGGARLASTPHHLSGHGRPEATSHLLSKNSPQPSMDEAKSRKKTPPRAGWWTEGGSDGRAFPLLTDTCSGYAI